MYRYLLQTNDQPLTTLEQELDFIRAYFHLLQMRFGSSVALNIDVAQQYAGCLLPPLTLQLLVENAVKHNVILASRPLHIEILTTSDGCLLVSNNLQKKTIRPELARLESTQVGLSNIRAKYQLLAQPEPIIQPGPTSFTVILPLLQTALINA